MQHGTNFRYEYSPELFTQTEPDFAVEVCDAVHAEWFAGKGEVWGGKGQKEHRIIFVRAALPSKRDGPPC